MLVEISQEGSNDSDEQKSRVGLHRKLKQALQLDGFADDRMDIRFMGKRYLVFVDRFCLALQTWSSQVFRSDFFKISVRGHAFLECALFPTSCIFLV